MLFLHILLSISSHRLSRYATLVINESTLASSSLMRVLWSVAPRSKSDKATPCASSLFCIISIDFLSSSLTVDISDLRFVESQFCRKYRFWGCLSGIVASPLSVFPWAGISSVRWRGWIRRGRGLAAACSRRLRFWPGRQHYKLTFLKPDLNYLWVSSDAWPNRNIYNFARLNI